jgi:hypothetical protein
MKAWVDKWNSLTKEQIAAIPTEDLDALYEYSLQIGERFASEAQRRKPGALHPVIAEVAKLRREWRETQKEEVEWEMKHDRQR